MLALAACDSEQSLTAPPCPHIIVVKDTAELTAFLPGPGRDLTDVVLEARIEQFDGTCETDLEDDRSGQVEVDLQLFFQAIRGPASTARENQFDFYVAIANRDGAILAKKVFTSEFEFEGNRSRVTGIEELSQVIPLRPDQLGDDFDIFVGFQLSPEQLDYNRAKLVR